MSYVLFNGVYFMYTLTYIGNTIVFYSELQHKLAYVTHLRPPNKSEVVATVKVSNQTIEVVSSAYAFYHNPTNYPTKKNNLPAKNNKMATRASYLRRFLSFFDELYLMREQRREQRRLRTAERLDMHRVKMMTETEMKDEYHMVQELGFIRCGKCKWYTSPSGMLEQISCAVIADNKALSHDEGIALQKVIMNKNRRKPCMPSDLEPCKLSFLRMETSCKGCKCKHNMDYDAELVCKLQESCIKLVYENMAVIQFEHDICV